VGRELWEYSYPVVDRLNTDSRRKRIMSIFNKTMPLHISPNLRRPISHSLDFTISFFPGQHPHRI